MTARQQLARLLPLALLVVLVFAGLRGAVPAPRWNGPLRAGGVAIGLALEGVLGVLLVITLRRGAAAARAARGRPYTEADDETDVAAVLRFVLRWVLGAGMVAIATVLIVDLHLHFFTVPKRPRLYPVPPPRRPRTPALRGGPGFSIPVGPILYGLLVLALVAAVVISVWWAARLRRPAGRAGLGRYRELRTFKLRRGLRHRGTRANPHGRRTARQVRFAQMGTNPVMPARRSPTP